MGCTSVPAVYISNTTRVALKVLGAGTDRVMAPGRACLPLPVTSLQHSEVWDRRGLGQGKVAIHLIYASSSKPPPCGQFPRFGRGWSSTQFALDAGICDSQAIGRSGMGV